MRNIILVLTAVASLITAKATEWQTYRDDIVGYSITYPGLLHLIPPIVRHPEADQNTSWTWRTKSLRSEDGKVELYLETHSIAEPKSLEQFFNEKLANRTSGGDHIGYVLTKNNWYVISGVNALGFEFYEKFYEFPDSAGVSWYIYFDFIYPHAQHKIYDPMVATIAASFIPKLPGNNYDLRKGSD